MMTIQKALVLFLFAALPIGAQPAITSVSPSSGPTAGGITVTVKGTGFQACLVVCSPPVLPSVLFGGVPSQSVTLVDQQTLLAVLPKQLPLTVAVGVVQVNGTAHLLDGFTYTGSAEEGMEQILLPILMPPIHGAFGSDFRTELKAWHRGGGLPIHLLGIDTACTLASPVRSPSDPITLRARDAEIDFSPSICNDRVGRLLWVQRGTASDLATNLRVRDVSRELEGAGTEIPVVRESDFLYRNVALLNVPLHKKFRQTLRIYALGTGQVEVSLGGVGHLLELTPGRDIFEPGYAEFTDFPTPPDSGIRSIRVEVNAPGDIVIGTFVPIWAMVTVTNNDTQQITAITPN